MRRSSSRRSNRKRSARPPRDRGRKNVSKRETAKQNKSPGSAKRRKKSHRAISDRRMERALRVLTETGDVGTAARSIRVAIERFKRAAQRRGAIRKNGLQWIVARRLPRKMPIYTAGRQLAITVNSKTATLIARYMSAVGQFLKTNDPKYVTEFKGLGIKDASGKIHPFEIDPNTLYRLSHAGGEPFEEMYRILI